MISLCTAYLGLKTYEIQKGCAYVSRKEISCRKHLQREYEVLYTLTACNFGSSVSMAFLEYITDVHIINLELLHCFGS